MTIAKGLTTVVLTGLGFGLVGAAIGYLIGTISPEFYRIVFSVKPELQFDSKMVGLALGIGQGATMGVVVGLGIVLLVTWYEVRELNQEGKQP